MDGSGAVRQTVVMPELPEVTALAAFLTEHAAGQPIVAVNVASLNVLTTYDPPASALVGRVVTGPVGTASSSIWSPTGPGLAGGRAGGPAPAGAPGPGRLAALVGRDLGRRRRRWAGRSRCGSGSRSGGFDITEAGTKKSVAAAIVRDPQSVPGVARLGPDALTLDRDGPGAGAERADRVGSRT